MSTTLDEARGTLLKELMFAGVDKFDAGNVVKATEALIDAKLAVAREEIARSRAPVGEDERAAAYAFVNVDDGMGVTVVTPPAKDTGEEEIIADLEQRLIEAKTERDEARSSLETAERRIGEAKVQLDTALTMDCGFYAEWYIKRAIAALTPDAGTARSEDEEGE